MEEKEKVGELIRKEVDDWDSEEMVTARFKAFSGQRSDWDNTYLFWRHLIITIARSLGIFIIRPSQVKNIWFNHRGLTPLCIDHVLLEMYSAGDLSCCSDLMDPRSGKLTQIFHKVKQLLPISKSATLFEDELIISALVEEKSVEVIKLLSDNHWTSSCVITMSKFQEICGGPKEASVILSHLSKLGKAKYLAIKRKDLIEGVKVSLSTKTVLDTTSLDYDVLHLSWTAEKLQLQVDVIDQRHHKSKMLAMSSLKSGDKISALRHARELKLASQSSEKCSALLRRVEEVLRAISDAEDSKEVLEAIKIGTKAVKDNKITMEEVQLCLEELDETIDSQKQVDKVLESTWSYADFGDEDIEDELDKLQLEDDSPSEEMSKTAESLSNALSDLKLTDNGARESFVPNASKGLKLEASS